MWIYRQLKIKFEGKSIPLCPQTDIISSDNKSLFIQSGKHQPTHRLLEKGVYERPGLPLPVLPPSQGQETFSAGLPAKPVEKVWKPLPHLQKNWAPETLQLKMERRFYSYLGRKWEKNIVQKTAWREFKCPRQRGRFYGPAQGCPCACWRLRGHTTLQTTSLRGYSGYLTLKIRSGLMGYGVTVKLLLDGEERGRPCVKHHPWVLLWTSSVPSPPEGSWWFSLLPFHRCSARLESQDIVLQVPRVLPQPQ